MFPRQCSGEHQVGLSNIRMARKLVSLHGFNCVSEYLGGTGHRHVIFEVKSGNAWVKHAEIQDAPDEADAIIDRAIA